MTFSLNYFRRHVLKCSTNRVSLPLTRKIGCPSKIAELGIKIRIKHNVFRFYISVHKLILMKALNCLCHLEENFDCDSLRQSILRVNKKIERAIDRMLQNQVNMISFLNGLLKMNDVWMGNGLMNLDFSFQIVYISASNFGHVNDLYGLLLSI